MSVKMLHDYIQVEPEEQKQSSGGILIPGAKNAKPIIAKVVAVGPGKADEQGNIVEINLKPGDKLLLSPGCVYEAEIDGKNGRQKIYYTTYASVIGTFVDA